MRPSIFFDGVSKKFRRGERHDSLRDLIPSVLGRFRRRRPEDLVGEEFWALRDVSFAVRPGEALGIIGGNGAGKSTSLKLLTRILRPTSGHCGLVGRVGALIEVAAGFHPDLTGRENIYLQGAIMGMTRAETTGRLDEIIEFAGVGAFIDTPVKRYSSGMNARLGFSIAAHLRPDVLVIDEVLSVGDMGFQQKCVDRMLRFKKDGAAIVFVSHNLQAVTALCDRAVHLRQSVQLQGSPQDVIRSYLASTSGQGAADSGAVLEAALLSEAGGNCQVSEPRATLTLNVRYRVPRGELADLTYGVILKRSTDDLVVYDANFQPSEISPRSLGVRDLPGSGDVEFQAGFRFQMNVTRGQYHFVCHVMHAPTQRVIGYLSPAAHLTVEETRTWGGIADLGMLPIQYD